MTFRAIGLLLLLAGAPCLSASSAASSSAARPGVLDDRDRADDPAYRQAVAKYHTRVEARSAQPQDLTRERAALAEATRVSAAAQRATARVRARADAAQAVAHARRVLRDALRGIVECCRM